MPNPVLLEVHAAVKLALVHDWLTGMRGGEKCLEIICRQFPNARLFTLLHVRGSTSPAIERMRITPSFFQRLPAAAQYYRYLLPLMPRAVERLRIPPDTELVLSFSHAVAKGVRPPPGVPHLSYCFTPMRYAWHRREDYFRRARRPAARPWAAARDQLLDRLRRWDQASSRRVTHFVAISRTVAKRIAECYGRSSQIIYPPVDTRFFTPNGTPRDDFYLCVSALVPYKRIDLAVQACNRLRRRLLVIGTGPQRRQLARLAGPTITLAGWRPDEEVRDAMRRARALLFPGHEDFGIVPVEAQACGTPVIAFGQGGVTETVLAGRPATGLFFDRQDPESLAQAIRQFESTPQRFCPRLARRQAERFAAERFQRELVARIEQVAARPPAPRARPTAAPPGHWPHSAAPT